MVSLIALSVQSFVGQFQSSRGFSSRLRIATEELEDKAFRNTRLFSIIQSLHQRLWESVLEGHCRD